MRHWFGLLVFGVLQQQPAPVRISVRVVDVRPEKGGQLHVSLHREPGTGFPGPSGFANQDARPAGRETILTFEAPPGVYAVAVHHDANANGKLDSYFFGMPKEGWGVSNDPRPRFRPPRFSEGRVVVTRDTTLVVRMAY